MLLDGSRSRGAVVLVGLGAKGHEGLHGMESWRAARDIDAYAVKHEPRPTASGSNRESLARLVTLSKGP